MLEFLTNETVEYVMYCILFLLVFLTCFTLFSWLKKNSIISKGVKFFYNKSEADTEERLRLEKIQRAERGNVEKESLLLKLDKTINYSNIKKVFPFLNANVYVFSLIIIACIAFLIGTKFWDITIGIAAAAVVAMIFIISLLLSASITYKKVEKNLVTFMNLVENYSKTNNDLLGILEKVTPYLAEPLKSCVANACYVGNRSGDLDLALETLSDSVSHKRFRLIIRNLQICSHHEANYEEVIEDSRASLLEYLKGKRENAAMVRSARIEIILLLILIGVVFWLMASFIEGSMILALRSTLVGEIIFVFLLAVLLYVVFELIFMGGNKE